MTKKKITTKAKVAAAKKNPRKSVSKKSKAKKAKSKIDNRQSKIRKRLPVSLARAKRFGLEFDSMTEAEQAGKFKGSLGSIFQKHPKLAAAFERGRFLRNLALFAEETLCSKLETANAMEMEPEEFKKLLDTDLEASDTWNQTRLELTRDIKKGFVRDVKAGKAAALNIAENILRGEIAHGRADFDHITIDQLCTITGNTRQTVHSWHTTQGLARNSDKTFSLPVFIKWLEEFTLQKADRYGPGGAGRSGPVNELQTEKARKLRMDIAAEQNRLLDRGEVLAGIIARLQVLVNMVNERKADDLAIVCCNQPQVKIAEALSKFFAELLREQCHVPPQLQLPPKIEKKFIELLKMLQPEGEGL